MIRDHCTSPTAQTVVGAGRLTQTTIGGWTHRNPTSRQTRKRASGRLAGIRREQRDRPKSAIWYRAPMSCMRHGRATIWAKGFRSTLLSGGCASWVDRDGALGHG